MDTTSGAAVSTALSEQQLLDFAIITEKLYVWKQGEESTANFLAK
jgi:hypothetical protein